MARVDIRNVRKAFGMGIRTQMFNHWRVRAVEHGPAGVAGSAAEENP